MNKAPTHDDLDHSVTHIGIGEERGYPELQEDKKTMTTRKHTVEFDAHQRVTKKVPVKFQTAAGDRVSFKASKKVKEPVHVKFKARGPK